MPTQPSPADRENGLEDLMRSVRALARSSRNLGLEATQIAERELAMAIQVSEEIRDRIVSQEFLERARADKLSSNFREDAHRGVDLVFDAVSVAAISFTDLLEGIFAERRPDLKGSVSGTLSSFPSGGEPPEGKND